MSKKQLQEYKDLLVDKKAICTVAVGRANKPPHITPVWFKVTPKEIDDRELTFNTLEGRVKANLLHIGTKLSINIIDPDEPSRYLSIDGEIAKIINGEEGTKHIHELSRKYNGQDASFLQPGDKRIKYVVKMNEFY